MDHVGRTLRSLSLHDEALLDAVAVSGVSPVDELDDRTCALVRFAAMVCLDAPGASFQSTVDRARATGVDDEELVGVLRAVAPLVGGPRLVAGAAALALALGYDLDGSLERLDDHDLSGWSGR